MAPDNSGLIYAVGSDKTIKQFKESQATKEIDLHTITLSTVVLSHEGTMLFTGSTTGTVYTWEQSPSQSAPTILVLKTWIGLWPWKKSGPKYGPEKITVNVVMD